MRQMRRGMLCFYSGESRRDEISTIVETKCTRVVHQKVNETVYDDVAWPSGRIMYIVVIILDNNFGSSPSDTCNTYTLLLIVSLLATQSFGTLQHPMYRLQTIKTWTTTYNTITLTSHYKRLWAPALTEIAHYPTSVPAPHLSLSKTTPHNYIHFLIAPIS